VELGSLLTALIFLGSAVGAVLFGPIGQRWSDTRGLQKFLGILTLIFVLGSAALLTGALPVGRSPGIDAVFFLLGVFANGWYALALDQAAQEAVNAGSAGLATAGYSLASNVGVAVVPSVLGPLVVSAAAGWFVVTTVIAVLAATIPFVIRMTTGSASSAGEVAP
jgi:DHA1 family inner membrane transport protein